VLIKKELEIVSTVKNASDIQRV